MVEERRSTCGDQHAVDDGLKYAQWYMVGPYLAMTAPAESSGPQVAREALGPVSLPQCLHGTMMRSLTPR